MIRYRISGKNLRLAMLILLTLTLLTVMTGCGPRYVVVDGGSTVTVSKKALDDLVADVDALEKALTDCRGKK